MERSPEEDFNWALGHVMDAMPKEIDASRVMVANGRTKRSFDAKIIGTFERLGADSWHPFSLVLADGGPLDVFPGVRVQVEAQGSLFRMRAKGGVVFARWQASPDEAFADEAARHAAFLERYVDPFSNEKGSGVLSHIARTLGG